MNDDLCLSYLKISQEFCINIVIKYHIEKLMSLRLFEYPMLKEVYNYVVWEQEFLIYESSKGFTHYILIELCFFICQVSVSCGIPDFRSRNGIYSRLAIDFPDLPDPQAMFDIQYFSQDPRPFFKFAREIYPGQFKPSPCHRYEK